jgi:hypothetical protein
LVVSPFSFSSPCSSRRPSRLPAIQIKYQLKRHRTPKIPSDTAYRAPLLYNLAVGRAILRHIYIAERLNPPLALDAWTSAYRTLWARAASRTWWREAAATGELARVAVYALEAYGIFKVRCLSERPFSAFFFLLFVYSSTPPDWRDRRAQKYCWVQIALDAVHWALQTYYLYSHRSMSDERVITPLAPWFPASRSIYLFCVTRHSVVHSPDDHRAKKKTHIA